MTTEQASSLARRRRHGRAAAQCAGRRHAAAAAQSRHATATACRQATAAAVCKHVAAAERVAGQGQHAGAAAGGRRWRREKVGERGKLEFVMNPRAVVGCTNLK